MSDKDSSSLDRMLVKISHLDTLLNLVGEVIITSNNIQTTIRVIQDFYDHGRPLDKLSIDMIKSAEVSSSRIASDLHSLVMDIRMVEISQTFQRFRRSIRDMAKESDKSIEFVTLGEETLVDKTIAEKLYDPLTHQIRNAVDHGVEDPLERRSIGKKNSATITLKAYQKEGSVIIKTSDDGRGIDPDNIARAAIARGVITEEVGATLSVQEKLELIFHPGLSTKKAASRFSGRGVGMDVVRSNIEELGGQVTVETNVGTGTTFIYKIPQITAVNIVDCLTVRVGANFFAIPILNVGATLGVSAGSVSTTFGTGRSIIYLDKIITLFDMNELLGDPPLDEQDEYTVVIVDGKMGRIAVRVSELLSPEKLVFTPLSDLFSVQGISGTTMISGNKMGLIIDIDEIIKRSKGIVAIDEVDVAEESLAITPLPVSQKVDAVEPEELATADTKKAVQLDIGHQDEFLMELEEIIKNVDEQILSLEQNPDDMEIINHIFRDFHSMKGNLMMVGLAEHGNMIHDVEAILDQVREASINIDSDIIDILLDSSDIIKGTRQAIIDNQVPDIGTAIQERIAKYRKSQKVAKPGETIDVHQRMFELSSLERFNLMAHRYTGKGIYQVYLSFNPGYQLPFLVALLVLKRIARIGHVFGTVPDVADIENQNIDLQMKVMFSSSLDPEEVDEFIRTILVKHYDVREYESIDSSLS